MSNEDIKLLFIDLCSRLLYGVKVCVYEESAEPETLWDIHTNALNPYLSTDKWMMVYPENVKPYLRPMKSMRDKEEDEYNALNGYEKGAFPSTVEAFDWLNKKHFDYRGLIEKGLALEAPEGMYND